VEQRGLGTKEILIPRCWRNMIVLVVENVADFDGLVLIDVAARFAKP